MPVSSFMVPPATKETSMAKKLARHYRRKLKSENVHTKPWDPAIPVEAQSVFKHFVSAAKIVLDEGADPAVFIAAQFNGLRWAKRFPFPAQLATPNARLRYMEQHQKLERRSERATKEEDFLIDDHVLAQKKLDRIASRTGMSHREVLRSMKDDFSREFRAIYGVK